MDRRSCIKGEAMAGSMKDIRIVYEDSRLIVIDKPSGMLTMSTGRSDETTAYSILYDYVKMSSRRPDERLFIVHRLDRDTSGLLVFAKDHDTKTAMQENWDRLVLERKYTAILEGHIEDEEGWIETWLHENPKSMKVHCHAFEKRDDRKRPPVKGWQFASSHCRTLRKGLIEGKPYTCVEFELETGRKNQIRVHSEWIGHPIAGDRKYGAETNPLGRLALHAHTLGFIHPWTGRKMRFTSRPPGSFSRLKEGHVIK